MKKYFLTVIMALLVGFLLSKIMLKSYQKNDILPVFKENVTAYLIQQGVYSTIDSMKNNTTKFNSYIYSEIDGKYYVYIGMTLSLDNAQKIKNYYKSKNIDTILKTTTLNDPKFISSLKQYDEVLKQTDDQETIKKLQKQILDKYKGE